jgi:4'-phosphopantetheinyl transferase
MRFKTGKMPVPFQFPVRRFIRFSIDLSGRLTPCWQCSHMKPDWPNAVPAATPLTEAVQVWRVRLAPLHAIRAALEASLTPEEIKQAEAFRHAESRARFVGARAALRELLAAQLRLPPAAVRFVRTERGKPQLHPDHGAPLQFNVSHSGGLALLALARSVEVGVDVEVQHAVPQALDLAQRYFAPAEAAALEPLPEAVRAAAFLRLWTRKEAQLKATGSGLADSLATPHTLPGPWTMVEFAADANHPAALAVRAAEARLTFHDLTDHWFRAR